MGNLFLRIRCQGATQNKDLETRETDSPALSPSSLSFFSCFILFFVPSPLSERSETVGLPTFQSTKDIAYLHGKHRDVRPSLS